MDQADDQSWQLLGESVCGSSHRRAGLPNQDAIARWTPTGDQGMPAIMVVSDGHGSSPHFRSEIGAALAVDSALSVLRDFAEKCGSDIAKGHLTTSSISELPEILVPAWTHAVTDHLTTHPFSEKDWSHLPAADIEAAREAIASNPLLAYGATLLAVLVANSVAIFLQLGDGDILCVDDRGQTTRPMPEDKRLVANQTTSLCQPEATREFRLSVLQGRDQLPVLIVVSTDGYANAFRSDEDFLLVGHDYLNMLRTSGADSVRKQLGGILTEASTNGSGDDITVGLMRRMTAFEENIPMSHEADKSDVEARPSRVVDERVPGSSAATAIQLIQARLRRLQWGLIISMMLMLLNLCFSIWIYETQTHGARGTGRTPHAQSSSSPTKESETPSPDKTGAEKPSPVPPAQQNHKAH
jgi:serine/threonine protein phosphatase PrpC